METKTRNQEIAETILKQLGGRGFVIMTGSNSFGVIENGLRMNLARNATSANRLDITLNGSDLYDVRFYRRSFSQKTLEVKIKTIREYEDVFCDQLRDIFSEVTGMYLEIPRVIFTRQ